METYMTLVALAQQLGTRYDHLLPYVRREEDPLPVRYLDGKRRGAFVFVPELEEWMGRNTTTYKEMKQS